MLRGAKFLSRSALAASFLLLAAPAPTVMPAAADTVDRTKTVIFDMDSGRNLTPDVWNPYVPSAQRSQGLHQAMMEPLFILNYETGAIQPWIGDSMTPNAGLDQWTLKIHPGVTWSDGVAFSADDVVFSINMLLSHAPDLVDSANM